MLPPPLRAPLHHHHPIGVGHHHHQQQQHPYDPYHLHCLSLRHSGPRPPPHRTALHMHVPVSLPLEGNDEKEEGRTATPPPQFPPSSSSSSPRTAREQLGALTEEVDEGEEKILLTQHCHSRGKEMEAKNTIVAVAAAAQYHSAMHLSSSSSSASTSLFLSPTTTAAASVSSLRASSSADHHFNLMVRRWINPFPLLSASSSSSPASRPPSEVAGSSFSAETLSPPAATAVHADVPFIISTAASDNRRPQLPFHTPPVAVAVAVAALSENDNNDENDNDDHDEVHQSKCECYGNLMMMHKPRQPSGATAITSCFSPPRPTVDHFGIDSLPPPPRRHPHTTPSTTTASLVDPFHPHSKYLTYGLNNSNPSPLMSASTVSSSVTTCTHMNPRVPLLACDEETRKRTSPSEVPSSSSCHNRREDEPPLQQQRHFDGDEPRLHRYPQYFSRGGRDSPQLAAEQQGTVNVQTPHHHHHHRRCPHQPQAVIHYTHLHGSLVEGNARNEQQQRTHKPKRFIDIPTDDELRAFLKKSLGSAYPHPSSSTSTTSRVEMNSSLTD